MKNNINDKNNMPLDLIKAMMVQLNELKNNNEELFVKALILLETNAESEEEIDQVYSRSLNMNLKTYINPLYCDVADDVKRGKPLESSYNEYYWMH